jgi:hypothetical protein
LARLHAAREADRTRVVQALAAELERLRMEKAAGEVYYHGTRPSLVPKIMREGLDPRMMGTGFEGDSTGRKRVSLSKNKAHAAAYMRLGAGRDADGFVSKLKAGLGIGVPAPLAVRFPKGKEPTEVVPAEGHGGMDEYHAYERIPPGWIEKKAYKLQGQTEVQGIPVAIENRKGSVREGTDSDGNEWRTKMKNPYGYIKGTRGADGEPVDVYVGPDKEAPAAFVVHQHKDDGTGYDEDKVMLGFKSKAEAKKAYLEHYDDPKFLGPISRVSVDRLRELVASKKKLVKISQASYAAMLRELEKQAYELSPREKAAITNTNKAHYGLGGMGAGLVGGGALGALAGRVLAREAGLGGAFGASAGAIGGGYLGAALGRKKGQEKWKALEQMEGKNTLGDPNKVKVSGAITSAQRAGILPDSAATQLKRREQVKALRKAGPGIGGALGAGIGALVGLKRGNLLKSTLTGLGTGATLGWIPDMTLSAREAVKRYRQRV